MGFSDIFSVQFVYKPTCENRPSLWDFQVCESYMYIYALKCISFQSNWHYTIQTEKSLINYVNCSKFKLINLSECYIKSSVRNAVICLEKQEYFILRRPVHRWRPGPAVSELGSSCRITAVINLK